MSYDGLFPQSQGTTAWLAEQRKRNQGSPEQADLTWELSQTKDARRKLQSIQRQLQRSSTNAQQNDERAQASSSRVGGVNLGESAAVPPPRAPTKTQWRPPRPSRDSAPTLEVKKVDYAEAERKMQEHTRLKARLYEKNATKDKGKGKTRPPVSASARASSSRGKPDVSALSESHTPQIRTPPGAREKYEVISVSSAHAARKGKAPANAPRSVWVADEEDSMDLDPPQEDSSPPRSSPLDGKGPRLGNVLQPLRVTAVMRRTPLHRPEAPPRAVARMQATEMQPQDDPSRMFDDDIENESLRPEQSDDERSDEEEDGGQGGEEVEGEGIDEDEVEAGEALDREDPDSEERHLSEEEQHEDQGGSGLELADEDAETEEEKEHPHNEDEGSEMSENESLTHVPPVDRSHYREPRRGVRRIVATSSQHSSQQAGSQGGQHDDAEAPTQLIPRLQSQTSTTTRAHIPPEPASQSAVRNAARRRAEPSCTSNADAGPSNATVAAAAEPQARRAGSRAPPTHGGYTNKPFKMTTTRVVSLDDVYASASVPVSSSTSLSAMSLSGREVVYNTATQSVFTGNDMVRPYESEPSSSYEREARERSHMSQETKEQISICCQVLEPQAASKTPPVPALEDDPDIVPPGAEADSSFGDMWDDIPLDVLNAAMDGY